MQSKRNGVAIPTKMEFIEQFLVLASSIEIDINPLSSLRDETFGRTGNSLTDIPGPLCVNPLYVYQCKARSNKIAVLCLMLLCMHQVL
jgi:hypothetical protein